MGLVALKRLRWSDGEIQPGDRVPEGEVGRDYDTMLHLGEIAEHADIDDVEKLQERLDGRTKLAESLAAGRDEAVQRAEAAEKAVTEADEAVASAQDALAAAQKAVSEANDTITAKDARIAELEQDVESLSAPAPATDPAAAKKPPAKPKPGK